MSPEKPGILMRLSQPLDGSKGIKTDYDGPSSAFFYAAADDGETPSQLELYFLDDIATIADSPQSYTRDIEANPDIAISWVICELVNGLDKDSIDGLKGIQPLQYTPALGSKIVINGSTPRIDKETDYHEWYDVEHASALAEVPGWNAMRRYKLIDSHGDVQTASFYGVNFWDEQSGLGGPVWENKTKTQWTFRIRENAAKPNIRRVWKVVDKSHTV